MKIKGTKPDQLNKQRKGQRRRKKKTKQKTKEDDKILKKAAR